MKLVVAPAARREIDGAWEFIAHDNIDAANTWTDKLGKEFQKLRKYPQIGRVKWDALPNLRCWPFGSFLIFYDLSTKTLTITRVISGYREISEADFGEI